MTHAPTSVCAITALHPDGEAVSMVVGTFVSVSIEPPLIGFFPSAGSSSYARLRECPTFVVNVLAHGHEELVRVLATKGASDKLAGVGVNSSPGGLPIIDGVAAWFECSLAGSMSLGDHDFIVGEVLAFEAFASVVPLVYLQGSIGSFRTATAALPSETSIVPVVRAIEAERPALDGLASDLGREVVVFARVGDELIAVASVGEEPNRATSVLGRRLPFAPPFGALLIDGDSELRDWLARSRRSERLEDWPDRVERARERGASVALVSQPHGAFDGVVEEFSRGSHTPHLRRQLLAAMSELEENYEPDDGALHSGAAVRSVQVRGRIADVDVLLAVHGISQEISPSQCEDIIAQLARAAAQLR
ncbi:flavin reductase family protein [Microbacterium lushaniae]|uniref:flavin reductase family protein n=1 Tax=Microbacterium lushaniae TaxID=2614639 RepID=UPI00177D15F3|nr:flavin reductase family protein [Microbacterium lushaniae]